MSCIVISVYLMRTFYSGEELKHGWAHFVYITLCYMPKFKAPDYFLFLANEKITIRKVNILKAVWKIKHLEII